MDKAYPRIEWKKAITVIFASGPSLNATDVDFSHCANFVKTIAVNESWRMCVDCPDIVYGADPPWWKNRRPMGLIKAELWTQDKNWQNGEAKELGLMQIESRPGADISLDPTYIFQGANSSFQAMNLAILFGSRRIVFLGLDLGITDKKTHWHEYPDTFKRKEPGYAIFRKNFEEAAPKLKELGIEVINASRRTTIDCFPQMTIQEALVC